MAVLCSGSLVADIIASDLPHIGQPGSLTYAPNGIHITPGGHAANVSIALSKLGQSNIHVASSIGNDILGQYFKQQLNQHNIYSHLQVTEDTPTSKAIALIVKGEDKRFIAELTSNAQLKPEHLINVIKATKPRVYYQGTVGGLKYVDPNLSNVLEEAHKHGSITLVDTIPPTENWKHVWEALSTIDILHLNEYESLNLTGHTQPKRAIKELINLGTRIVIVSQGEQGLTAGTNRHIVKMSAFSVPTVDPTGAGDALSAGLIKALLDNYVTTNNLPNIPKDTLVEVLLRAQAAGAACVTGIGATTAVTWNNQEKLLREQGNKIRRNLEQE